MPRVALEEASQVEYTSARIVSRENTVPLNNIQLSVLGLANQLSGSTWTVAA